MTLKHTRIEVNNAVFSLPYHVAKEEGYFADEGFDVELVPAGSGRDRDKEVPEKPIEDHTTVTSYGWHEGIEKGEFCMYRACEWGQIRRTQDSGTDVRVISKRAAVATQAIVVRARLVGNSRRCWPLSGPRPPHKEETLWQVASTEASSCSVTDRRSTTPDITPAMC